MMNYQQLFTAHTETRQQARVGLPAITIPHLIVVRPIATAHTDWSAISIGRATANIASVTMSQIRQAARSFKPAWSDAQQDHFLHAPRAPSVRLWNVVQEGVVDVDHSMSSSSKSEPDSCICWKTDANVAAVRM